MQLGKQSGYDNSTHDDASLHLVCALDVFSCCLNSAMVNNTSNDMV